MTRVPSGSLAFTEGLMMLDGTPFTGVGYIERNGEVIEETDYRDGLKWGVSKTLFPGGRPYKHSRLFMGVRHGKYRQWHFNGEISEEADYELGFVVRRKRWDEDGDEIEEFQRDTNDPEYKNLEQMREHYKDVLQREQPSLDLD